MQVCALEHTSHLVLHPTTIGNHHSALCLHDSMFLHSTYEWWVISDVFVFAWLISRCIIPSRPIHVVANGRISFLYMAIYTHMHTYVCIYIYNIIYVLYLIYPFVCWQTIWVVSMFWQMSWLLWLMPHEYWSKDISYIYLSLQISMQKWNHCITDWFCS